MNRKLLSLSALLSLGAPEIALADPVEQRKFFASKYTYCDAKMLSFLWRQSIDESKSRIGRKVGWGDDKVLEGMLRRARNQAQKLPKARCNFHEAGFTYQDAEKLSRIWRTSPGQSKSLVEQKIMGGGESKVRSLLGKPRK
jgi:hypothetical protein